MFKRLHVAGRIRADALAFRRLSRLKSSRQVGGGRNRLTIGVFASWLVYAEREMRAKKQARSRSEICRERAATISTAVDALARDALIEA